MGYFHDKELEIGAQVVMTSALLVFGGIGLMQLLELAFRNTASHAIFRLAVVDAKGERAKRGRLYFRWAIIWLPLFVTIAVVGMLINRAEGVAFIFALIMLGLWIGAAVYAVIYPHCGLHDKLAGTWVVRR